MYNIVRDNDDYDTPDIYDILKGYSEDLNNTKEAPSEFYGKMIEAILYEPERRKSTFEFIINILYQDIISVNYINEKIKDPAYIYEMVKHSTYLKLEDDLRYEIFSKEEMEELCRKIYSDLCNSSYGKYIPKEMPEEFKYENILNVEYQMNKIYEKNKDREEFKEVFASDLGRWF